MENNGEKEPDEETAENNLQLGDADADISGGFDELQESVIIKIGRVIDAIDWEAEKLEKLYERRIGLEEYNDEGSGKHDERILKVDTKIAWELSQMNERLGDALDICPSDDLSDKIRDAKGAVENVKQALAKGEAVSIGKIRLKLMNVRKHIRGGRQPEKEAEEMALELGNIEETSSSAPSLIHQMIDKVEKLQSLLMDRLPLSEHKEFTPATKEMSDDIDDGMRSDFNELGKRCALLREQVFYKSQPTPDSEAIVKKIEESVLGLIDEGMTEDRLIALRIELAKAYQFFTEQEAADKIDIDPPSNWFINDIENRHALARGEMESLMNGKVIEGKLVFPPPNDVHTRSSARRIDSETYKKVQELRRLGQKIKDGKLENWERGQAEAEIRRYIRDNFDAFDAKRHYPTLWESSDDNKHNFMKPREEPHPAIKQFMMEVLTRKIVQHKPPLRIMELGTGIGNDADFMFRAANKNGVNIARYHGIDISPAPVLIARARVKNVLNEVQMAPPTKYEIEEADFISLVGRIAIQSRLASKNTLLIKEPVMAASEDIIKRPINVLVCINAGHYQMRAGLEKLLSDSYDILEDAGGYLVIAQKTPESDSADDHTLILNEDGYKLYLHKEEHILRAFIEFKTFTDMVKKAGFEIEYKGTHTVEGYDFPDQKENFSCVIAKKPKPKT